MAKVPLSGYTAKLAIQYARELRDAQKTYFASRQPAVLTLCKRLEGKLDRLLAVIDTNDIRLPTDEEREAVLSLED